MLPSKRKDNALKIKKITDRRFDFCTRSCHPLRKIHQDISRYLVPVATTADDGQRAFQGFAQYRPAGVGAATVERMTMLKISPDDRNLQHGLGQLLHNARHLYLMMRVIAAELLNVTEDNFTHEGRGGGQK